MRILLWSASFWPRVGGVEVLGGHFVEGLTARGHELQVITETNYGEPEREVVAGVPVIRLAVRGALEHRDVRALAAMRGAAVTHRSSFRPDIDHLFNPGPDLILASAALARDPAPVVLTLHNSPDDGALDPAGTYGRTLRDAGWVVACSQAVLDDLHRGAPDVEHCSVIENALPSPPRPSTPPPSEPVLLMIGRLASQKGFDLGLEALAMLRERSRPFRAIIAGDGPERTPLERRAAELGLDDVVEFTGWVEPARTGELMAGSTAVVMPSRFEPYGLVALEAAQNARPLVGFAVDGLPEVVTDGKTGMLVNPGDVPALAAALATLIDDPELATQLGEAGHRQASEGERWERHLDAYEELFTRLHEAAAGR